MRDTDLLIIISLVVLGCFYLILLVINKINGIDTKQVFNYDRDMKKATKKNKKLQKLDGDTTYIGINQNRKKVFTSNNAKHIFICGTTGSGKTVALSNYLKSAIDYNYPLLIVDGKGDIGENSIYDIVQKLKGNRKVYVINLNNPKKSDKYNPFKNTNPTIVKDMLINLTSWSEEHYKLNTERYLQKLVELLFKTDMVLSLKNIVDNINVDKFLTISMNLVKNNVITKEEHIKNLEIVKASGQISESATARFSTIIESELGAIFDEDGIDIYTALEENSIILFILNPLIYPEISPLIGNLVVIDSKKAVSKLFHSNKNRIFFVMDEINVYASKSLLDLVNKSRSANVTCILATQSLSDLDEVNEHFKEQIIENCNNYIILRQNISNNAEQWSNIVGTRKTLAVTYQLKSENNTTSDTGLGSARRTREFLYHPDDIKNLPLGKAIYVSKDNSYNSIVFVNKPF